MWLQHKKYDIVKYVLIIPATYQVNGKQYVVIACGGGSKLNAPKGDSYVAFALPEND